MNPALTIHTAGIDLNAEARGSNPRAVFLHGLSGYLHSWDGVWDALGADFPSLRYDLRGHGLTRAHRSEPYSDADDLLALLDATRIEQADLIGVSLGGSVALNFCLDHPQRVRRLVLISPGLVGWEWSEEWRQLWRPIVAKARAGDLGAARQLWWQHPLFDTVRQSAAGPALFESIMRFSCAPWIEDRHRLMLPDVDRLYRLETPCLLLTGGHDLPDFRLIADLIENCATRLRRIDRPDLGHLLQLEDPLGCAEQIRTFVGSNLRG